MPADASNHTKGSGASVLNILLAVLSMVTQGTSDFIYKRAQERGVVFESYFAVECVPFAGVALLFGYLMEGLIINQATVLYGLVFGVFSFWAVYFFVSSLREGEVGVNTLIFRLNFVLVAVFAILWLGEPWTAAVGAGLIFAALGIASVTLLAGRRKTNGTGSGRSIGLALLAMVLFAMLGVTLKIGIQEGANIGWAIVLGSMSWAVCACILVVARKRYSMPRANWVFLPMTGCLKAISFSLMLFAFRRGGNASVVVPIVQLSFLVTMIWAAIFLGEPLTRSKIIGLAFAVAAILAFSAQGG